MVCVVKKPGMNIEHMRIADNAPFLSELSSEYSELYEIVTHKEILNLLQSGNKEYVASLSYQKGCLNSALFCQEIILFLTKTYPERFALYEHTPISKVVLHEEKVILDAGKHTIESKKIVLCTNGFEGVHIINEGGLAPPPKVPSFSKRYCWVYVCIS